MLEPGQNRRCIRAQGRAATCCCQTVARCIGAGPCRKLDCRVPCGRRHRLTVLNPVQGGFGIGQARRQRDRPFFVQALRVFRGKRQALAPLQGAQAAFAFGQNLAQAGDLGLIGGNGTGGCIPLCLKMGNGPGRLDRQILAPLLQRLFGTHLQITKLYGDLFG